MMDRARAVAHGKRAPGGAVVVIEQPGRRWETASASMVEDPAILAAWDQARSALAREGVRIYVPARSATTRGDWAAVLSSRRCQRPRESGRPSPPHRRGRDRRRSHSDANRAVSSIRLLRMPGSVIEWPASGTMISLALGHALWRSHADRAGHTTS